MPAKAAYALALVLALLLGGCSSGPQPIAYGQDGCAYCKMTISDERFGAEIITRKGKVYKFDATECMIKFVNKEYVKAADVAQYLVADANSGTLIDVGMASFLVSENLTSPMGGNISAYTADEKAQEVHNKLGGARYDWMGLQQLMRE